MTHLDLFSGIGGFALAAKWAGFTTIGFCEIDAYAQKVLTKNFGAQVVADAERNGAPRACVGRIEGGRKTSFRRKLARGRPIFPDIRALDGRQFAGVDLVTGGFPCQPFSLAGQQRGAADDRHLWPEMLRVIEEARPDWIVAENVPGLIGMEFGNYLFDVASLDAALSFGLAANTDSGTEIIAERVLGLHSVTQDLQAIGYAVQPVVVPACAVDARHRRDRVWIVANREGGRLGELRGPSGNGRQSHGGGEGVADAASARLGKRESAESLRERKAVERGGVIQGPETLEHAESCGRGESRETSRRGATGPTENGSGESSEALANADGEQWQRSERDGDAAGRTGCANGCGWPIEPAFCRVANGVPRRVDRLRGLGNAIVPQVAFKILEMIKAASSKALVV